MWLRGFLERLAAIILKEVLPLSRDKLSFAMLFGMPILELLIFGYAINTDPHNLPTAVVVADQQRRAQDRHDEQRVDRELDVALGEHRLSAP